MPEKSPPALSSFAAQLQALIARRGLDEPRAAGLLGVPVFTLRKWAAGTRTPSASALRLLDILGTLEALAPALLEALEPPPVAAAPRTARGRARIKAD